MMMPEDSPINNLTTFFKGSTMKLSAELDEGCEFSV